MLRKIDEHATSLLHKLSTLVKPLYRNLPLPSSSTFTYSKLFT